MSTFEIKCKIPPRREAWKRTRYLVYFKNLDGKGLFDNEFTSYTYTNLDT